MFRLNMSASSNSKPTVNLTNAEWKAKLTEEQYRILRLKDTEYPGTGIYNKHFEKGIYKCSGCGQELYEYGYLYDFFLNEYSDLFIVLRRNLIHIVVGQHLVLQ